MSEQGTYEVKSAYSNSAQSNDEQAVIQSLTKIKDMYEKVWDKVNTQDFTNIIEILPVILELQLQKSSVYGRSYCRHGDLSIFFNTERKWDRIVNIMEKAIATGKVQNLYSDESGTPTETFFDTVVDLASYSLLWLGYIAEHNPQIVKSFMETNKLGD